MKCYKSYEDDELFSNYPFIIQEVLKSYYKDDRDKDGTAGYVSTVLAASGYLLVYVDDNLFVYNMKMNQLQYNVYSPYSSSANSFTVREVKDGQSLPTGGYTFSYAEGKQEMVLKNANEMVELVTFMTSAARLIDKLYSKTVENNGSRSSGRVFLNTEDIDKQIEAKVKELLDKPEPKEKLQLKDKSAKVANPKVES